MVQNIIIKNNALCTNIDREREKQAYYIQMKIQYHVSQHLYVIKSFIQKIFVVKAQDIQKKNIHTRLQYFYIQKLLVNNCSLELPSGTLKLYVGLLEKEEKKKVITSLNWNRPKSNNLIFLNFFFFFFFTRVLMVLGFENFKWLRKKI